MEENLIYQAQEVITTLQAKSVIYDLKSEDDLSWGQSSGCDGTIEVYIEPMAWVLNRFPNTIPIWPYIHQLLDKGVNLVSAKCVNGAIKQGTLLLYSSEGEVFGYGTVKHIEQRLVPYLEQFFERGDKVKLIPIDELENDFLFEQYLPKDLLYIFGAGPDAEPRVTIGLFSHNYRSPRSSR